MKQPVLTNNILTFSILPEILRYIVYKDTFFGIYTHSLEGNLLLHNRVPISLVVSNASMKSFVHTINSALTILDPIINVCAKGHAETRLLCIVNPAKKGFTR